MKGDMALGLVLPGEKEELRAAPKTSRLSSLFERAAMFLGLKPRPKTYPNIAAAMRVHNSNDL